MLTLPVSTHEDWGDKTPEEQRYQFQLLKNEIRALPINNLIVARQTTHGAFSWRAMCLLGDRFDKLFHQQAPGAGFIGLVPAYTSKFIDYHYHLTQSAAFVSERRLSGRQRDIAYRRLKTLMLMTTAKQASLFIDQKWALTIAEPCKKAECSPLYFDRGEMFCPVLDELPQEFSDTHLLKAVEMFVMTPHTLWKTDLRRYTVTVIKYLGYQADTPELRAKREYDKAKRNRTTFSDLTYKGLPFTSK